MTPDDLAAGLIARAGGREALGRVLWDAIPAGDLSGGLDCTIIAESIVRALAPHVATMLTEATQGVVDADRANQQAQLRDAGLLDEFAGWIGSDLTEHLADALVAVRREPVARFRAEMMQAGRRCCRRCRRGDRSHEEIMKTWADLTDEQRTEVLAAIERGIETAHRGSSDRACTNPMRRAYELEAEAFEAARVVLLAAREERVTAEAIADACEECGIHEDEGYGHFPGGDPRRFHPDPECSTEEERAQHRADCEAWDRGESVGRAPACQTTPGEYTRADAAKAIAEGADLASVGPHGLRVVQSTYGLGTYDIEDVPDFIRRLRRERDEARTAYELTLRADAASLRILYAVNAQIPSLPAPLRLLHGPLLATVETWSDGTVVARLPVAALYGEGQTDTAALADLVSEIVEFSESVRGRLAGGAELDGPLKAQWEALAALATLDFGVEAQPETKGTEP